MTNDHEELELAKAQAKEIWKILDYVRGASPISNYRSLAYSIFFVRYLQSNTGQHFEAGRFDSFNVITLYSYDLINYAVQLGLIHSDVSQFLIDYLENTLHSFVNIDESFVRYAIRDDLLNKTTTIASLSLSELDLLFAENEGKSGGEFYTPIDVNLLVKTLGLSYQPKSICDPFAGAGNTAFPFANTGIEKVRIDTQEINRDAYFKLVISRTIRKIEGRDYFGDSLSQPLYQENKYDLIVSFPPFGMKIPKATRNNIYYKTSNKWLDIAEILPESRSDWFITLSMLPALTEGGKILVGMSLGALTRTGSEAKVREYLVSRGIIEQVILLPKNIHYSTAISTVLLVLNSGTSNINARSIKFVDASLFYEPARGRNTLTTQNINEIVEACHKDGRFSISSSHTQIANRDFNLDPSLYVRKDLKISEISLKNFRGYSDFKVSIHPSLNVLVGENGVGKTSILEALACGLGPFLTAMPDAKGKLIKKSDIHISTKGIANYARISIETTSSLSWDLVAKGIDVYEPPKIGTSALTSYATHLVDSQSEYPLIAYYGTNRALTSTSSKVAINPFEKENRGEGYDFALDAKVNYGILKNWFSKIEVDELRKRDELKDHKFIHPAKRLVSEAVYQIVDRATCLEFDKNSNDVIVHWKNEQGECVKLTLEQLSEGYRNVVSLTIDLVRRAYLLNPTKPKPLTVNGIVLIDEIELHLHPRWQQKILNDLTKLFKNIQFIVTTHSPQVLTTISADCIRIVSVNANEAKLVTGTTTYGSESSRMLEDVLGGNNRAQHLDIVKKLNRYTELVEADQWDTDEALELKKELYKWGGQTEDELLKLETDIRIREFERGNEKN
ncbi:TPA: N-6 DNA methylase [Klebsiella pneumoniae]|uniref:N-6 DNA methylase n=1 Tax=Klebsiella pneumoniae TaxID=573 RepID=UPI000D65409E|nr:N-6 DNA methylase [Klebsiella pneumoniae]EIX9777090.1 N-6 DNA methylase [Klebsiella pneumoniae]MBW6007245.1 type I restriction endonuclease subunit M [Klebsiella pneumoniae]MCQ8417619.1 N-6 DNA methylase [Klebsiella pneumoniae]PWS18593.1 type I restriction endonuclease subunit M [Klebsiella pneumoniae]RBI73890.1 type I restriction endonuclease subunit M [Klebsiella pneumoniae]